MNPSGNLKELEEQCMCSICLQRIKDVATLKCGHSYCVRCLEPLVRPVPLLQANQEPRPNITCPICRKVHHFEKNETIQSLGQKDAAVVSKLVVLEKAWAKAKKIVLEICQGCRFTDRGNAVFKCLSCDVSLCHECLDKHDSQDERKQHFIALLEEGENGKSILLCRKHSLCLKYFCNAKGCQQLICTDCVLSEHGHHEVVTFHEAKESKFIELQNEIAVLSPNFRDGEKMIQEASSDCLRGFESQEEILNKTITERKMNFLKEVTTSLVSAEQQVMILYYKKLWEYQSSLQPKIDVIRRKQQKIASIDRTLKLADKEDDLSFLVKAEHLKTGMMELKANSELRHAPGIDVKLVTKEITKDYIFDIMKFVMGDIEIYDVVKGTSEVIPIQLGEQDTKVDTEIQTLCQVFNNENEIMKLVHENRDPNSSKKEGDGTRDNDKGSLTMPAASGSHTQTKDVKRSLEETNENGASNGKKALRGNKIDYNFSTKPKPESQSKNSSIGNSRTLSSHKTETSKRTDIASIIVTTRCSRKSRSRPPKRSRKSRSRSRSFPRSSRKNRSRSKSPRFSRKSRSRSRSPWSSEESRDYTSDSQQSGASSLKSLICHRCGRTNHDFKDCFASRNKDGKLINDSIVRCYRCGRHRHKIVDCHAKFDVNHRKL